MMGRYFKAIISWIKFENGGRKNIPEQGTRYCPLIRIYKGQSHIEWSIDFICPDFTKTFNIEFKFLSDAAPTHMIQMGETYEIYEGNKKVAEIKKIT